MRLFRKKKPEAQIDASTKIDIEKGVKEAEPQDDKKLQTSSELSEEERFKKGFKEELVERILDIQKSRVPVIHNNGIDVTFRQLKNELREYDRIREELKTKIASALESIPKLEKRKEFLKKDINQMQQRIVEITELFPKLENENRSLQKYIQEKLRKKVFLEKELTDTREKIEEIVNLIPKLEKKKQDAWKNIQLQKEECSKIDDQIKQIQEFQKYGLGLLNTKK